MVPNKSLDDSKIIAALLYDIHLSHGAVFNYRSYKLTSQKVSKRLRSEGIGFLTKTLPRLCKAFDKCLAGGPRLNAIELGFDAEPNSQLPRFLGELFSQVLQSDGSILPNPCAKCVGHIRQVLLMYYKYELPFNHAQELKVLSAFKKTEKDLEQAKGSLDKYPSTFSEDCDPSRRRRRRNGVKTIEEVAREAKYILSDVFSLFDPADIFPRNGPGAVSTKEKLWEKFQWKNVSELITNKYPLDEYFYASLGHVCDDYLNNQITTETRSAKVILVPKDSRGPRLISCEPVDFQWIQQGLSRAIVRMVEQHPLTKWNVRFTSQRENQIAALYGSYTGKYATLDLNEASDRVSVDLVRLLFPPHICEYLEACRTLETELPDGEKLRLHKFAPMGSALCFPVLALTVWALLTAGSPDADTRESIEVYGDDVIVPTAFAVNAIELLESFGLKINRDKSCTGGLFRESCGMDAFNGVEVTPVRLRTVWSSEPSPGPYVSWIAYANQFHARGYFTVYDSIVELLRNLYGPIPGKDMNLSCPSLVDVALTDRPKRRRRNYFLQKMQFLVWDVSTPKLIKVMDGWSMLLRYFSEVANDRNQNIRLDEAVAFSGDICPTEQAFSTSTYTSRRTSMLVRRWR